MKKITKILSMFLAVLMAISIIPMTNIEAKAATPKVTLAQLQAKYPSGKYWNHADNPGSSNSVNNQDGYTSTPCPSHNGTIGTKKQTCNGFQPGNTQLSWQCMGYAEKLGYDFTGYNPRKYASNAWKKITDASVAMDSLKPGDIIRYKNDNHSIFVTKVSGDTITYTDCNYGQTCKIRWGATVSKSTVKKSFNYIYSAPFSIEEHSNTLSIKYDANGGIITDADSKYYLGSSDIIYKTSTGNVFTQEMVEGTTYDSGLYNRSTFGVTKEGYTFAGWGTKSSGGTIYDPNDAMTAKKLCSTIGDGDATITLYAIWEPNVLSVYYNANGGEVTLENFTLNSGLIYKNSEKFVQTWKYNVAKDTGLLNPKSFGLSRTGYTFMGWGTKSSGGTIFDQNDETLLPTDIKAGIKDGSCSRTLYAIWQAKTYTVAYDANGGDGTMADSSHTYDTAKTLNANKFTRTGYTFLGWSTSSTATVAKYTDKQSVKNLTSTNGGTVTLYAVWSKNEHTPGEWLVVTPATCTTEGLSRLTCTTCGEIIGEKEIPVAEHTAGTWVVTTEANCTTEGARYQSCKVCSNVIANEIIPEIGHTADDWEVVTEATCTTVGLKNQKCIVCKEIIATEEISTTDHTYGEFVTVVEPTCETAGIKIQDCYNCGEELLSEEIPALGHDYENGICKNCEAFTGIKDDYFYINGVKQKAYQLVEFEGNYYFINNGNLIAKNTRIYLSEKFVEGTDLAVGYYDFDADGKLMFKNGPEGDYFYKDGIKLKAYQLVEFEGDFYFINDGNKIAKNKRIYLGEQFVSGFTNADGVALKAGYYEFGADGKMAPMNGPVGDYFYRDNVRLNAYQLVEYNGDFYFINDAHKLAKNKRIYLSAKFVDGFTYSDGRVLKPGYYNFDENGKMLINGPVGDYFYKDSVKLKAYQLVEFEGDYYFINDSNKLAKNKRIYLSAKFVEGTDLAVGYYEFDENGKMLRLNGPVGDYFYENGVKLKAYQLVEFEGNYYFINDSNKLAKNKRLYMSEKFVEGTGLKAGYYEFDADGKMIIG